MKKIIVMHLLLFVVMGLQAQYTGPQVGEPMPEITLKLVLPEAKTITTGLLKGKPVIIAFISNGCMGAWHFLRDAAPLYDVYKERVRMIMVPVEYEHSEPVMKTYELYRKAYGLTFEVAEDKGKVVHKLFGVHTVPHVVWIDATGKVAAVSSAIDNAMLEKFSRGDALNIVNMRAIPDKKYSYKKPLLVNGNGGEDTAFFQRSVFARWKPGMPNMTLNSDPGRGDAFYNTEILQVSGRKLKELYRIAYIGKSVAWQANDTTALGIYRYQPVLEVTDSSLFQSDHLIGTNLFCYSQTLPRNKRTRENMMQVMQADLKNCFGYEVTVETRRTPYWRLIAGKRAAKLLAAAKPGQPDGYWDMMSGGRSESSNMTSLLSVINYPAELIVNDRPLMDETGITGPIDFELHAAMTSLEDVKRALKAYDLYIVPGVRDMKVIVIRDPAARSIK